MSALALVAEKPMDEPTELGKFLKTTRKSKGLTQQQLADAAGCKVQYVSGLETGGERSRPASRYVDAWAQILNVPENTLRDIAGHPRTITSEEQAERVILDYYENASEPSREIMRAVLQTIYEVDKRRAAEAAETPAPENGGELQAEPWPGGQKDAKKAPTKRSKRR